MANRSEYRYVIGEAMKWFFAISGVMTLVLLVGIFIFLFVTALGAWGNINLSEFLFGTDWNPTSYNTPTWGTLALAVSTLMVSLLAMLLAVPFGLAIAICLSEIVSLRSREILKPILEMIASIPSVTLGILGILFLAPLIADIFGLSNGLNGLTASILVAIAALPTIASICEDALFSVPFRLREASLALGASKWVTIRKVVIPAARSGLIAAIMLGLGRVIGETMIVLMVAGNSRAFPTSFLDPVRSMTANIAIEIKETVVGGLHWDALFAIGVLLFILTFLINLLADVLIHKKT